MGCPPAGARPLAGTSPTTATPNDTNACLIVIGASLGRGLYHDPRTTCLNGDASLVTLLLPIWPSPRGAASTTRGCAAGILTGHQRLDLLPRCQRITRPRPWPRGVIYGSKLRHTPAPAARTSPPPPPASPFPRREPRPELGDAARTLGAVGVVLWSWDARSAVLRPSLGDGYPQAVLSALPDVPRDAENAVAAAFRRAEMCVVTGGGKATGALALPVMAPVGCIGVLALEFRNGVELRESVRAGAARLAADVVNLVVPVAQRSSVA